jgi:hypothetical protein
MSRQFNIADRVAIIRSYYELKNAEEVRRRWSASGMSPAPAATTVRDLVKKFEQTGSVLDVKHTGRPQSVRTDELRGNIAASLERSPQKSTRRLSAELGCSHVTVYRALKDMNYHPFRPRLVHGLLEDDPLQRVEFCERFMNMVEDNPTLVDRVIWSDEAMFKLNGHINRHNCVYWDSDNPKIIMEKEVNAPGVMAWAGIWSEGIIGPFFFDGNVDGPSYLALLNDQFWPQMGRVVEEQDLWFMQDGAPAHWAKTVRAWLNEKFPRRWIGRGGEIPWPPRSPDLTPPDFFLWGVLKDRVYATKPRTIDELKAAIERSMRGIHIELCQKVCRSVPPRLQKCMALDGLQTELF